MKVSVHPGADQDLSDAFRFYGREAGAGVARRFPDEFGRVAWLLNEFPDLGTLTGDDRRTYPLTGFPYSVLYRQTDTELRVLVLRHQSRSPNHGGARS
ncbi:MAG: type II toxin-antitoxin system RelE/ParE family toxin [Burkholderiaceae bacterium]|nr:type II toxin-antitoxin system RelE/ParE family toxin [Burkholderiaceae bacterium]